MNRKDAMIAATGGLFCISLFQLGLIIPSLYFGYEDENSTCQAGTRGGINLSDWIKIFGFEKVGINTALFLTSFLTIYANDYFIIFGAISVGADFFFNIAWWIWGVVVLATSENNRCVAEGKGMAVMAIIDLVLGGLWFLHLKVAALMLQLNAR